MKRLSLAVMAGVVALAGCSAGANTSSAVPKTAAPASTIKNATVTPYSLPFVTNATSQSIARYKQNSIGGIGAALIDAPAFGPNDQVNFSIVGVAAVSGGNAYPIASYLTPVTVDVLSLQQAALFLGENALPNGSYDALRLIVNVAGSNAIVGGTNYPLSFASTSNGLANIDLPASINASTILNNLVMDFDVMESVAIQNGVATVMPWGRVADSSTSSAISGTVVNNAGQPVSGAVVIAQSSDGSVNATTQSAGDGTFQIHAIPGATYAISIANTYTTHVGSTLTATNADSTGTISVGTQNVPTNSMVSLGNLAD